MKNNKYYFLSYKGAIFGLNLKGKEYVVCVFSSKTLMNKFATAKNLPPHDIMEIRNLEEFLKQFTNKTILITRIIGTRMVYKFLEV